MGLLGWLQQAIPHGSHAWKKLIQLWQLLFYQRRYSIMGTKCRRDDSIWRHFVYRTYFFSRAALTLIFHASTSLHFRIRHTVCIHYTVPEKCVTLMLPSLAMWIGCSGSLKEEKAAATKTPEWKLIWSRNKYLRTINSISTYMKHLYSKIKFNIFFHPPSFTRPWDYMRLTVWMAFFS